MELKIIDKTSMLPVYILEQYQSFIWADKYCGFGDFELYTPMDVSTLYYVQIGNYIVNNESDRVMVIERVVMKYESETGYILVVTGRSAESLLTRRIVWGLEMYESKPIKLIIQNLFNICMLYPEIEERKVYNFDVDYSQCNDHFDVNISVQFTGDTLYDAIVYILERRGLGFKVTLNHETGVFSLVLFEGKDHSIVTGTSPVVFSTEFDNLIASDYSNDAQSYSNVALIGAEGEGIDRDYHVVGDTSATGLERRELFVDARDIRKDDYDIVRYYNESVEGRGYEKLYENRVISEFSAEVEPYGVYKYSIDYSIGDLVTISDILGNNVTARVSEFIISDNNGDGLRMYPKFELIS